MQTFVIDEKYPHLGGNIFEGDECTFCPEVWSALVADYKIKTVLDIGCGTGKSTQYFAGLGCQVIGVEGLPSNVTECKQPTITHDISKSPLLINNIEMIWCCEVIEHIEQAAQNNLLQMLANCKILVMTYAEPGQSGHHHVNCQTQEYWIAELAKYNMHYNTQLTEKYRALGPKKNHFSWHGLIFIRKD